MSRRALLAATVGLLATHAAWAQPAWVRDAMRTPLPPVLAGSNGAVLLDRTELVVDDHLRVRRHEMRAIRILRPAGADLGVFVFAVEPGGKRDRVQAWTVGNDRADASGDRDVAETTLDPEHYTDVRRVLVRAPTPRVGDTVAAEFTSEEPWPFASYTWAPQERSLPVARAELAVELPEGWTLDARASGFAPREQSTGARRHEFSAGPLPGVPPEQGAPPPAMVLPREKLRFDAPAGATPAAMRDWPAVARWYDALASPHCAAATAPGELLARADARTGATTLASLAGEVQHRIAYAAIELGQQRWEPDAAGDTWARHYGDCKDKSVLLVAALAASGIEARPVLACTREAGAVDPDWPDPAQFNHCIVAVAACDRLPHPAGVPVQGPSGKTWFLFDPTDPGTPLGLLPWGLGGTYAVIADPAEGLVQLPRIEPGRIQLALAGRLDGDGTFTGTVRLTADHAAIGWLTAQFEDAGEATRSERLGKLLGDAGRRVEASHPRWRALDSLACEAGIEADVSMSGLVGKAGQTMLLAPPFPLLRHEPPPPDSTRTNPLWLGWSPVVEERFDAALPAGLGLSPQPAASAADSLGDYTMGAEETAGRLVLARHLALHADLVPAARWPAARAFLETVYRGDNAPVLLRPR